MDMSQYRDLFISESRSHLEAFNELVVQLERDTENRSLVDELFRHAHSLKGMAATMQFEGIAVLAHKLEDLLSKVRDGAIHFVPVMADMMLEGSDLLGSMVNAIERRDDSQFDIADLSQRLTSAATETDRRDTTPAEPQTLATIPPQQHQFRQTDSFKTVRIKTEVLDHLVAITGELITTHHILQEHASRSSQTEADQPLRQLASLVRDLRDEVFRARMLPFAFIAERFPRLVRDLARKQGKEVELQIAGNDCELDRGVLEEIAEPLVHILRNAVDHGLEHPDERVAAGKPYNGTITLTVSRDKDHVDIVVRDDGRGMNPDRLVSKAIAQGVVTPETAAALSPSEVLMLVCAPGFSTAESVTDISGRGVGMDAVKTAIHMLGGILSITSHPGAGSTFLLQIPLTVSIIHALLVSCANVTVAFPVSTVERTLELTRDDIFELDGRKVCLFEGEPVPIKNLNRMLGQSLPKRSGQIVPALVAKVNGTRVVLLADRILGQQEIFIKPLGKPLSCMKWCSGGTILGDGSIVFVVDVSVLT